MAGQTAGAGSGVGRLEKIGKSPETGKGTTSSNQK